MDACEGEMPDAPLGVEAAHQREPAEMIAAFRLHRLLASVSRGPPSAGPVECAVFRAARMGASLLLPAAGVGRTDLRGSRGAPWLRVGLCSTSRASHPVALATALADICPCAFT